MANPAAAGTRARTRTRGASSVAQDFGRYNARLIKACRQGAAWVRTTATWAFSMLPAVPVY